MQDDPTKVSRPHSVVAAEKEQTDPQNVYSKFLQVLALVKELGLEKELRPTIMQKVSELGILDQKHSLNQPGTVPLEKSLDRMKKLSGIK